MISGFQARVGKHLFDKIRRQAPTFFVFFCRPAGSNRLDFGGNLYSSRIPGIIFAESFGVGGSRRKRIF